MHYRMRQKLVSIGDDYWIEDGDGRRAYKVDGKALRVRETLNFDDASGNTLLRIQERMLRVRDTMEIEDPGGRTVARVKQAMITPLRDRMTVEVEGGPDLKVQGNLLDHEYKIEADGAPSPRCPSGGSGWRTPTASRSSPARTTSSSSP